jgi:hypothetical protein
MRLALLSWSIVTGNIEPKPIRIVILLAALGVLFLAIRKILRKIKNTPKVNIPSHLPASKERQEKTRYLPPVLALLFLAPWVGEYLLGNISIKDIVALPILLPMYGCGALLIREVVRRTGRGWAAILLLGAAYGLIEAGLADLTLFSPPAVEGAISNATMIPGLEARALDVIGFIAGHAIWSIGIPIALTEMLYPSHRNKPWLRKRDLIAVGLLYGGGCALIFSEAIGRFSPSLMQVLAVIIAAAVFISAALLSRKSPATVGTGRVPAPWVLGVGTFMAAGIFMFKPESWVGVAMAIALLVGVAVCVSYWARQRQWSVRHRFAVVAAGIGAYAGISFILTVLTREGSDRLIAWAGNVLFALMAICLLLFVQRRNRAAAIT